MKDYVVYVKISFDVAVGVEAESEEEAMAAAEEAAMEEPLNGLYANVEAWDIEEA